MKKLAFALVLACACGEEATDRDDDHSVDRLVVEGDAVAELFGSDGVSDPIHSTIGFRRLGVLWDATEENVLELRTSLDGNTWTDWRTPEMVLVEMIAHAGHVDAITVATDVGSIDTDALALHYQLRVPAGRATPTFITVEPLVDIPARLPDDTDFAELDAADEVGELAAVNRPTPIGTIKIHSRADWGAKAPRCASDTHTPNRATIHHTVTPTNDSMTAAQRLRQIQAFHQNTRGWCDIGYNYLVSRDGRVWRGRGAGRVGAHVANANTGNLGISFIGTHTTTAPTETQMCNTAKLLRRLHEDFSGISLNRTDVKGHRQLGSTSCPGNALYSRIDKILRKARNGCAAD
ncbi:MAG: N-acetylmuramoyl-L-alanine amidase [Myxococcota bacterium]|nr:N-acetylmuramoyl-L-alanine amidase [Myxococcota bacterium]